MFTTESEETFLLSSLNKTQKVLEYGSGESTIQISVFVDKLISIEHQEKWFNNIKDKVPENCILLFKPPNTNYHEGHHCGTYDEFKDYIEAPLTYGPFNVIIIDGRARVACCSICNKLANNDTIIFIHDFHRDEYQECLKYLTLIEQIETMGKFKLK